MISVQDLELYIKKSGLKKSFLCKQLGISSNAWNRRMHGKTDMKVSEVQLLIDLLDIPNNEISKIFFNQNVGI